MELIVYRPFAVNTVLALEVRSEDVLADRMVRALIENVRPLADQQWLLGCRLCEPPPAVGVK
jgi:hypothetical protein